MPQPFLDYLPSESSPREDRAPLPGPLAPLQLSTVSQKRASDDLITHRFTDSHAFDAVAWIPCELWTPFRQARRPAFPVALGHRWRDRSLHQLHLLRSFIPSTSPFALTRASSSLVAVTLLVSCPS